MNRRKFIQLLSASAAGVYALDPDMLLWVPGQKTIFIPPEKHLIFASEISAVEWERTMDIIKEIYDKDKLLYEVLADKPKYKHETGDYKTVQIYHGFKIGRDK